MNASRRWIHSSMMMFSLGLSMLAGCTTVASRDWQRTQWAELHSLSGVSLRGLSVVDRSTVWATGSGGTVLRSTDGGRSWQNVAPADSAECDFRDVHAFDKETAIAMVAGQPARIYRTEDGGASWSTVHEDDDERAFFDSIAFDGKRGFLFGDPIRSNFYVWCTDDAGLTWKPVGALPKPASDEAGFAASGTCISLDGRAVRIATGGGASRCLRSTDGGATWDSAALPLLQGAPSQGAFSIAFTGSRGVAVGGDYRVSSRGDGTAAWTVDRGLTWHASTTGAGGFRSAAVWLDGVTVLAVGQSGASLSTDGGNNWQPFDRFGFHAAAIGRDGSVFACGSDGRIAVLESRPPREFAPTSLFGDHMVMPANTKVMIRGFGEPGARVSVHASWRMHITGRVDATGRWRCELQTPGHSGPHTIVLESGDTEVILRDVLVGDVWLCSGQSNMEMPIGNKGGWQGGVDNWEREVADANHPTLRVFTVTKKTSGSPLEDVKGQWRVCSPETAAAFSATAYFFGRELVRRECGPIGLVVSSWGGTVCEAWTSPTALGAFPEFADALAATRQPRIEPAQRRAAFWHAVPEAPDDSKWQEVTLPGVWSKDGLADFDGVAFYRRQVDLPVALRGKPLQLNFGAIDDMDTVWCNGVRIGGMEEHGAWSTERSYSVPSSATASDRLDIIVRVVDTGGEGGFSSDSKTMQLRSGGRQGTTMALSLAGTWLRQTSVKLADLPPWPPSTNNSPNRPAVLWNGMIEPLLPFPFTGCIWYQGESNLARGDQYSRLFPAMIRDWRRAIGSNVPFHFVQIAPYNYAGQGNRQAPELREGQAAALQLPATGMAVTLDIGNARDIHPRNKQEVGRRLALHALKRPYGKNVVADGPTVMRVDRAGREVRITFKNTDRGLRSDTPVRGFEVAGADREFVAAEARIDADAVLIGHPSIADPLHVRYAWAAVPEGSLRNGSGLPAAPFRSSVKVQQQ